MKSYMQIYEYTTDGIKLIFDGTKDMIVDFVKSKFPMYNVGLRTPLYKIAEVIQSKYQLYSNGNRIYP